MKFLFSNSFKQWDPRKPAAPVTRILFMYQPPSTPELKQETGLPTL